MGLENIEKIPGFDNHKLITYFNCKTTGLKGYIAIHRGNAKYPSFGATRLWNYKTSEDALIDAVRLSKTMSCKAALAGLHCGGAKAVIISNGNIKDRKELLRSYAEKVNYLGGRFITGADVGISRDDVKVMRRYSPSIVGVQVDPVRFTGLGILYSIQTCLKTIYGRETIRERSFSIQGLGKIGFELLKFLYPFARRIYVSDIDEKAVEYAKEKFPNIIPVPVSEIYNEKVDVFSPCALSDCLNAESVKKLKCSIIAGGANLQLQNLEIGKKLHKMGILYAPDYLVNSGGLISVYDEYENKNTRVQRVVKRVRKIKGTLREILEISKRRNLPPFEIANELAQKIFDTYN